MENHSSADPSSRENSDPFSGSAISVEALQQWFASTRPQVLLLSTVFHPPEAMATLQVSFARRWTPNSEGGEAIQMGTAAFDNSTAQLTRQASICPGTYVPFAGWGSNRMEYAKKISSFQRETAIRARVHNRYVQWIVSLEGSTE